MMPPWPQQLNAYKKDMTSEKPIPNYPGLLFKALPNPNTISQRKKPKIHPVPGMKPKALMMVSAWQPVTRRLPLPQTGCTRQLLYTRKIGE
jgi:hypothetical protein